jgi:hypothetical protein
MPGPAPDGFDVSKLEACLPSIDRVSGRVIQLKDFARAIVNAPLIAFLKTAAPIMVLMSPVSFAIKQSPLLDG